MAVIGVDMGTSGCKATVVDSEGKVRAYAYAEYNPVMTADRGQEMDSKLIVRKVKQVISEVSDKFRGGRIEAVSVSSIGESVTPLNNRGEIIGNAMLYTDPRGDDVERQIEERVDRERFFAVTGYYPSKVSSLCRIMWMKKHKPKVFQDATLFLPYNSLILHQLGAEPHIEYTLASTSMAFDIVNKCWDKKILESAQIDPGILPPVVAPGEIVGEMSEKVASELGLNPHTILVAGGHDQQCVSLGSGTVEKNIALDGLGSVEAVGLVLDKPIAPNLLAKFNFSLEPHLIPNCYSIYACTMTAGRALKWYRDCFCQDIKQKSRIEKRDVYSIMMDMVPENHNNIFFIPYFAGSGTPFNDPDSKSILTGMDLNTTRGDVMRALLEGITFEIEINLECLRKIGVQIDEIRAVGGLAKSRKYLQMKADIMGYDITTLQSNEAGTLGAAMLAGIATGMFASFKEAVSKVVKVADTVHFNTEQHRKYSEKYEMYKMIHPNFKSIQS